MDKLTQEILSKFPCKVGDIIYDIEVGLIEVIVTGFRYGLLMVDDMHDFQENYSDGDWHIECQSTNGNVHISASLSQYGISLFKDKNEAIDALQRNHGGNHE